MRFSHPALCLVFSSALLPAQHLIYAEGATRLDLDLWRLDERNPSAAPELLLSGLEFLPIEITNRTPQLALQSEHSSILELDGFRWVELPSGGRLYTYQRGKEGETYGLLQVAVNGAHRILREWRETPDGISSEHEARIGVAADGRHAVVPMSGGRLAIFRLDGGSYASSDEAWREIDLPTEPIIESISPGQSALFVGTKDDRVWRIAFSDLAAPEDMTPPGAASAELADGFTISGDGTCVAFLRGGDDAARIYLLAEDGPVMVLPPPASEYEQPAYLPERSTGPQMLLNEDGSRLLYTDSKLLDVYLLDTSAATPTTHLTDPENFRPCIGIGILPIFIGDTLLIGLGPAAGFDLYTAKTGVPEVINVTQSAGNVSTPYRAGGLTFDGMSATEDGKILVRSTEAGNTSILRISLGDVGEAILSGVTGPLQRGKGYGNHGDYLISTALGDVLLSGDDGTPLFRAPLGFELSPPISDQDGLYNLFLANFQDVGAPIVRFANGWLLPLTIEAGLREITLTSGGGLVFKGETLRYLSSQGSIELLPKVQACLVLSGHSSGN